MCDEEPRVCARAAGDEELAIHRACSIYMLISILMNVGSTENQLWRHRGRRCREAYVRPAGRRVAFKFLKPNRDQVEFVPPPRKHSWLLQWRSKVTFWWWVCWPGVLTFFLVPMLNVERECKSQKKKSKSQLACLVKSHSFTQQHSRLLPAQRNVSQGNWFTTTAAR